MTTHRKQVADLAMRLPQPEKLLKYGLPALVAGGALLIALVWWFTLRLAGTLAVHHVEQKMADVAAKASAVLQSEAPLEEKYKSLSLLARFRDVQRIELHDERGKLIWRNYQSVSQVRPRLPQAGQTLLEKRNIDGMERIVARHLAQVNAGGRNVRLILQAEVDGLLARYSAVGLTVAKALSTVLLLAIFLMGYMLILRWREQQALAVQLRQLLDEIDPRRDDLQEAIAHLSSKNSELLRHMLSLGERLQGGGSNAGQAQQQQRKRA